MDFKWPFNIVFFSLQKCKITVRFEKINLNSREIVNSSSNATHVMLSLAASTVKIAALIWLNYCYKKCYETPKPKNVFQTQNLKLKCMPTETEMNETEYTATQIPGKNAFDMLMQGQSRLSVLPEKKKKISRYFLILHCTLRLHVSSYNYSARFGT